MVRSGVAFSHDPNTCSPCRVVNWTEGEDTAAVTSGLGGSVWQHAASSPVDPPENLSEVFAMLEELIVVFDDKPLDCEFAVTKEKGKEMLWLLQVRPLVLRSSPCSVFEQQKRLSLIAERVERGMQRVPFSWAKEPFMGSCQTGILPRSWVFVPNPCLCLYTVT